MTAPVTTPDPKTQLQALLDDFTAATAHQADLHLASQNADQNLASVQADSAQKVAQTKADTDKANADAQTADDASHTAENAGRNDQTAKANALIAAVQSFINTMP